MKTAMSKRLSGLSIASVLGLVLATNGANAAKYGPGATDTEIKIGHTNPYSGPASAYGSIGKAIASYWKMVNDHGGINGRKINFVSLDDSYSPPKTVEQIRKLVEQENVLFTFQTLGTPPNTAIQKYMNAKKVPQLFVATGASKWTHYKQYPWTMGWQPNYHDEAKAYAAYLLKNKPNAKVGILYQNDDYGKDYLNGFKEGLGNKASKMIVSELSYETSDPTVDSQIVSLKASGADVFFNVATPKFAAQAIRKAHEINWKPLQLLNNVSSSINNVLKPAGFEAAKGVLTSAYLKDPNDSQYENDKDMKEWRAWMKKYNPDANPNNAFYIYGYSVSATLKKVLEQAGDNLTRENIMREAANLKNFGAPLLLPGVEINTSPTDYAPIEAIRLQEFDGKGKYKLIGEVIGSK